MSRIILFFLLFSLPLGMTDAATINIASQSRASAFNVPAPVQDLDIVDDVDTVNGPTSYAASTAAVLGGARASSSGGVDIDTGVLRSRTEVALPPSPNATGHAAGGSTNVQADLGFTASGNGNVTFQLAVDGFWDLTQVQNRGPNWQAQGKLQLLDNGGSRLRIEDTFRLNQNLSPLSGVFDDVLEFEFFIRDGEEYVISNTLLTQISTVVGIIDFSNSAALSIFTTDGVDLIFDDPRVLTVKAEMSQIPVPPAVWGLVAALASLAGLRRRLSVAATQRPKPGQPGQ